MIYEKFYVLLVILDVYFVKMIWYIMGFIIKGVKGYCLFEILLGIYFMI